ncbi:MAG: serine/threonine protein kinase, partial [Lentisphaeraceae bacterium]|nr:serine/threonine protein kinase [Lentisphaeraceae bacterium]
MLDLKLIQLEGGDDDWDKSSFEAITNNLNDYNRYKTENLIATGGMKEIYKVFDNKNHRHVAMAKLRTDIPEEHCEDFIQEAQLTASLRHHNIITFYDSGVDAEGVPFFTLELKVGDNLAQILKKRAQDNNYQQLYSTDRLLNIFIKICDAISYAHSVSVIHLDLKPDNIQVGEFGEVQVCDWGLAINLNEKVKDEEIGRIKGTPGFMAPEQILNGKLDCQTDIYALGALLYCILCGDSAYQGGLETILKKTVDSDIAFLNEQMLGSDIPESLKSVIKTAMANEKNARYTNVEEMKKDIESYLSGHSTSVENASFYKELKLFYKRNMLICSVVIAALLIAAVASNYFLLRIKESNENLKISNDKVSAALAESEKNYALFKAKVLEEKRLTENILKLNVNQELENFQYPLFFTELYKKQAVSFDNTISSSIKYLLRYKDMIKTEEYRDKLVFALLISQNFDDVLSFEKDIDPDLFDV